MLLIFAFVCDIRDHTRAKTTSFWTRWQKSSFRTKYLSKYGTDRYLNFSTGRQMCEDYKTDKYCGSSRDVGMVTN